MTYAIQWGNAARKQADGLPTAAASKVVAAVGKLAATPRPAGCTKLAGGEDLWRIRVGDYRIVYAVRDRALVVLVVRVAHRREVYR